MKQPWETPVLRKVNLCDNCDGAPDGGHTSDARCIYYDDEENAMNIDVVVSKEQVNAARRSLQSWSDDGIVPADLVAHIANLIASREFERDAIIANLSGQISVLADSLLNALQVQKNVYAWRQAQKERADRLEAELAEARKRIEYVSGREVDAMKSYNDMIQDLKAEIAALKAGVDVKEIHAVDLAQCEHNVGEDAGLPPCSECVSSRLRLVARSALSRLAEAEKTRDFTSDWYKVRFERMDKWMRENAPAEARDQYFSIQANGQSTPWEKPAYIETIHAMKMAVADAEAREKALREALKEHQYCGRDKYGDGGACIGCNEYEPHANPTECPVQSLLNPAAPSVTETGHDPDCPYPIGECAHKNYCPAAPSKEKPE